MIDLVLKQFRQITFSLDTLLGSPIVKIIDANLRRPRDPHHQIRKAETIIPQLNLRVAGPRYLWIDERTTESRGLHADKDYSPELADLRSGNPPAVAGALSKRGQRFAEIARHCSRLRRGDVPHLNRLLPEQRI